MKLGRFVVALALVTAVVAIAFKLVTDYEYIPNLVSIESVKRRTFDWVVVGSGTAGSVIAYELSKNSNDTVLLIEAGGLFNGLSIVPLMSTLMQGTDMDWRLRSTPQLFSSRGLKDEQQFLPRGRGLGGSNQLNYLLHFDGVREDFDEWQRMGAKWTFEDVECHLKRHEFGATCPSDDADAPRLSIASLRHADSPLTRAFVRAQRELRRTFGANVTLQPSKFTTRRGVRHTVFHEYLRRAYKHRNLSVLVHATVKRVHFNARKEAVAVTVETRSRVTEKIGVRSEVILAAGAYHSPVILMRSGIGAREHLASAGIELVHHSPEVGANLFDHMNMPLFVAINETFSVTKEKVLSASEIFRYLYAGSGLLASTAVIGSGRVNDYGLILFGMGSADEKALKDIANFKTDAFRALFPLHANSSQEGFVALSTCYKPKSRGSIKLRGNDFSIDPQYLREEDDMLCMRNAIRLNIELIRSSAFRAMNATILWPRLRQCRNFGPFDGEEPSDRYLDCLLRHAALTAHHPGGTCSIGSVVDGDFNVIGVRKLRVLDASSIFPSAASGFPNSIITAVAEYATRNIIRRN